MFYRVQEKHYDFILSTVLAKTNLQRICGGFLACLEQFQTMVPKQFFDSCITEVHRSFLVEKHRCNSDMFVLVCLSFKMMYKDTCCFSSDPPIEKLCTFTTIIFLMCQQLSVTASGLKCDTLMQTCCNCWRPQYLQRMCRRFPSLLSTWQNTRRRCVLSKHFLEILKDIETSNNVSDTIIWG